MQELTTARLVLRPFEMEDVLGYYEQVASDGNVCRHLPEEPHQELGETLAWLEETLDRGLLRWAVTLDGELIGMGELTELEPRRWELWVKLAADHWGRGYGTEVVRKLTRYAFDQQNALRVQALPFLGDAASAGMLERAGFRPVAIAADQYEKQGRAIAAQVYELRRAEPPLTANDYQQGAMKFLNPALERADALVNGVMGLCGESGECIDLVKKHLYQGHELDREALKKELGDVAWYLAETAWAMDMNLEEVLRANLEKLQRRYPNGFSSQQSQNRK